MSVLSEMQNANAHAGPDLDLVVMTSGQLAALQEPWIASMRDKNQTGSTIGRRQSAMSVFIRFLATSNVTPNTVQEFIRYVSRIHAAETVGAEKTTLGVFFAWAKSVGAITVNPVKGVVMPQLHHMPKRRPYTHAEYLKLRDNTRGLSYRWLVVACYYLGLRKSGVAMLRWKDVDVDARRVSTVEPKTKRMGIKSVIPYVPWGDVEQCINELHLERDDTDEAWPGPGFVCKRLALLYINAPHTLSNEFTRTVHRAKVEVLGLHSLRRSFCSNIVNYSGLNAAAGMKMTGHQNFATYQQYVTVDDEVLTEGVVKAFATVQSKTVAMKQLKDAAKE